MVAEATAPRRENVPMAHSFLYRTHSIDTPPPLQKEEQASKPWAESGGRPDASSGIHDSPPGRGKTWGRHHQAIPEIPGGSSDFSGDAPAGSGNWYAVFQWPPGRDKGSRRSGGGRPYYSAVLHPESVCEGTGYGLPGRAGNGLYGTVLSGSFLYPGFSGRNETHGAVEEKVFKEGGLYPPFFDVILTEEIKKLTISGGEFHGQLR